MSVAAPTMPEIPPYDGWALAQVRGGATLNGELDRVSEQYRRLAKLLNSLPVADRQAAWDQAFATRPQAEDDAWTSICGNYAVGDPAPPDGPATPASAPWPPLRLNMPTAAAPFPLHVFPMSVQRFCIEVAESARTAIDFVGCGVIGTASAAIGQSVNVQAKRGWEEAPTFNIAEAAVPGRAKTVAIRHASRPMVRIDSELREKSKLETEAWEERKRAHAKDPDKNPPPGEAPPQLRAVVRDITRESLCLVLRDNPRGVLCAVDELTAWVGSFNQYKSRGGTDRQFWLSIWSSEPVSVDRKGGRENVHVPHPYVTVLGSIQPAVLATLQDDRGRDDGFLDRITFTYPDCFPSQMWSDQGVSVEAERDWEDVIRRLHAVDMTFRNGEPCPWVASMTARAKGRFVSWHDEVGIKLDDPEVADDRGGALAKSRSNMLRLALVLSRLRLATDIMSPLVGPNGVPPVDLEDVEGAIELAEYFEIHRTRAAEQLAKRADDAGASRLLGWIRRKKPASFREADAATDVRILRDPEEAAAAVARLTKSGAIRLVPETPVPGKRGPKPTPLYEVNPLLL